MLGDRVARCSSGAMACVKPLDVCTQSRSLVRASLRQKIIAICDRKISEKGEGVGVSFYAFFANKNDDPELLMEAAEWWIKIHQLDHFEKAARIRAMVKEAN